MIRHNVRTYVLYSSSYLTLIHPPPNVHSRGAPVVTVPKKVEPEPRQMDGLMNRQIESRNVNGDGDGCGIGISGPEEPKIVNMYVSILVVVDHARCTCMYECSIPLLGHGSPSFQRFSNLSSVLNIHDTHELGIYNYNYNQEQNG